MSDPHAHERAAALGLLGAYLIKSARGLTARIPSGTVEQWQYLDHIAATNPLAAIGLSMLYVNIPFQVAGAGEARIVMDLCQHSLRSLKEIKRSNLETYGIERLLNYTDLACEAEYRLFPNKPFSQATKSNVYFSDVWPTLLRTYPVLASQFNRHGHAMAGLYNDQATAAILMAITLLPYSVDCVELAIRLVCDESGCKALSTVLKACGANGTKIGAVLTEGHNLQGRGIVNVDLRDDALHRTRLPDMAGELVNIPEATLRHYIREVLDEELGDEALTLPDASTFWSSRWLWCVNGSHSVATEKILHGDTVVDARVPRAYRKAYIEARRSFDPQTWQGKSVYSPSLKYEHGKTRPIYGCDSDTYIMFEYLLRGVEQAWRHYRVVLDPGHNGTIGMCERINMLRHGSGINVMMDYDNFNMCHTLESQSILIDEVCQRLGVAADLRAKFSGSFFDSHVMVPHANGQGASAVRLAGSLMSGHRATTFINSVLNRVYLLALAPATHNVKAIHVGDDVYMSAPSLEAAAAIMDQTQASGIRMNPLKQSVGFYTAEFLRIATGAEASYGYACRSIASIISGNWVSMLKLTPTQALETLTNSAWALANRCGNPAVTSFIAPALHRWTGIGLQKSLELLRGQVGLGNGPVRKGLRMYYMYEVDSSPTLRTVLPTDLPTYATRDYLTYHTSDVERQTLAELGVRPLQVMEATSYEKSFAGDTAQHPVLRLARKPFGQRGMIMGSVKVRDLLSVLDGRGVLAKYPLLFMYKGVITNPMLRRIVSFLGYECEPDIAVQCWGSDSHGVIVEGTLPRSDAAMLSRRTLHSVITTEWDVFA
jgi:hypothetical protein